MGNNEIILNIDHLYFTYPPPERTQAIKDVSIQVKRGEVVALIGQNGSGKTTLARCVSGFLKPNKNQGEIIVSGVNIHKIPPSQQAKYVGYVFQNPDHQLFKDTVWDDVAFGLQNFGLPSDVIEDKVNKILKDLDLYHLRDLHPHRLAKGDKQRLAVAGILVMEAPIIIVDEPTTGQDPQRARDIMDLLAVMNKEKGTTIIVITHAMDLVTEYADRAIVLYKGELLLEGAVEHIFRQVDVLNKTFIEPPPAVQLSLGLGLDPLALTLTELKQRLLERINL